MLEQKDAKIMAYVPASKKEAVKSCYHDDDGYWIELKHGWHASRTDEGCHVIVQDNIRELRHQRSGIEPYLPERPHEPTKRSRSEERER